MSIAISGIFRGTHPKVATHAGAVQPLEKAIQTEPAALNRDRSASIRLDLTKNAKDLLSTSDIKQIDILRPDLSKQSPVSNLSSSMQNEMMTNNAVFIAKPALPKQFSGNVQSKQTASKPEAKAAAKDDIRNVGYYITLSEDSETEATDQSSNTNAFAENLKSAYNHSRPRTGSMVNLSV